MRNDFRRGYREGRFYFLRVEPAFDLIGSDPAVLFNEMRNEHLAGKFPDPESLTHKEEMITSSLRSCPGCGAPAIVRQVLLAIDESVMISNASGCPGAG